MRISSRLGSTVRSIGGNLPAACANTPKARAQISTRRFFQTGKPALDFKRDFMFGSWNSNVCNLALRGRYSADFKLLGHGIEKGGKCDANAPSEAADIRAARNEYKRAHWLLHWAGPDERIRASEHFIFLGSRRDYLKPESRYMDFMAAIVNTVRGREGKIGFTLGELDMYQHFSTRAAVEIERRESWPDYTFNDYIENHILGERRQPGFGGDGMTHVRITGLELGAFMEGRFKDLDVTYCRDDGTPLDTKQVRELYDHAAALCSSPENLQHLKKTGQFCAQARAAVEELQMFVHGTGDMLEPLDERELYYSPWVQSARQHFVLPARLTGVLQPEM